MHWRLLLGLRQKTNRHFNIMSKLSADQKTHIDIDLEFAKAAEEETSMALTLLREVIALRESNPHLGRSATLELTFQATRHIANAAERLPPVDEDGKPYGYEKAGVMCY